MKKYGLMLLALLVCGVGNATQDATLTQREVRDPRQLEVILEANATDAETRIAAAEAGTNVTLADTYMFIGNAANKSIANTPAATRTNLSLVVGTDVLAPGGDLTGQINSIAVATVTDGAALGTTSVQPADVWGAPTATPSPATLVNTVGIQAKTAAGGDLSEFRLIRVWTSETSMGAASTNNIETLVLSTGTAVDTVVAHADYRYVTATDGSAVATITGTATGTNYVMLSDGSSISATAITFVP